MTDKANKTRINTYAAEVRSLLAYPPDSAGRMTTEKFARLRPEMTAAETLIDLREINPDDD